MDGVLRMVATTAGGQQRWLPAEIGDRIARQVHEMNMVAVHATILHNVVWTIHGGELSFLVCERVNFYACLNARPTDCRHQRAVNQRALA